MSLRLTFFLALCRVFNPASANPTPPEVLPHEQFFNFITRPDILVPKWNVTIHDRERISPGYWFTAPYQEPHGSTTNRLYIGPQIYDEDGDLVWSSSSIFSNSVAFDFRVAEIGQKLQLTFIDLHGGYATFLNEHYEVVRRFLLAQWGDSYNFHEFNVIDGGKRALYLTNYPHNLEYGSLKDFDYHGACTIATQSVGEVDLSKADDYSRLFHWQAIDHLTITETHIAAKNFTAACSRNWDYLHANAVDECPDGDLLFSGRNTNTIYKISRRDGHIVWRLGGFKSDFSQSFNFSAQHHVRCHEANDSHMSITFMDNANFKTNAYSRGLKVALNVQRMTADIITEYPHPSRRIIGKRGTVQILPGGNVLTGWSEESLFTEYTADAKPVLTAHFQPSFPSTYRSYKFHWVGRPKEPPAVHSAAYDLGGDIFTKIHVSWNGATEVARWNVYRIDEPSRPAASHRQQNIVASAQRSGFETAITYDGFAQYVMAEGVDRQGNSLGLSEMIDTFGPFDMAPSEVLAQSKWLKTHASEKIQANSDSSSPSKAVKTTNAADKTPAPIRPKKGGVPISSVLVGATVILSAVLLCFQLARNRARRSAKFPTWWRQV